MKWVEGLADQELEYYASITLQVSEVASEPEAFRAEKPQGWGGVPGGLCPRGGEGPAGQQSAPAGFARGAGREWALPVSETQRNTPEPTPMHEGTRIQSRNWA